VRSSVVWVRGGGGGSGSNIISEVGDLLHCVWEINRTQRERERVGEIKTTQRRFVYEQV
jgi:hypothetical protein